jgi:hypothetical protein
MFDRQMLIYYYFLRVNCPGKKRDCIHGVKYSLEGFVKSNTSICIPSSQNSTEEEQIPEAFLT